MRGCQSDRIRCDRFLEPAHSIAPRETTPPSDSAGRTACLRSRTECGTLSAEVERLGSLQTEALAEAARPSSSDAVPHGDGPSSGGVALGLIQSGRCAVAGCAASLLRGGMSGNRGRLSRRLVRFQGTELVCMEISDIPQQRESPRDTISRGEILRLPFLTGEVAQE